MKEPDPISSDLPILYSFRRCPYAMRARMALAVSGIKCRLREVVLRDKPPAMIEISPKATVPVLQITDGRVIEESIEIMDWALVQQDPEDWLGADRQAMTILIAATETDFKGHLDRYKYPNRYENVDPLVHRAQALSFVQRLDDQLGDKLFLFAETPRLADIAIFPFIRQLANTDRSWWDNEPTISCAGNWLERCLALPIFEAVMDKYERWREGDVEPVFPAE